MTEPDRKTYFFDRPRNVKAVLWGFYAACGLALLAGLFIEPHGSPLQEIFGFEAAFGFLAYAAIVVGGEGLRRLVLRREDYYE